MPKLTDDEIVNMSDEELSNIDLSTVENTDDIEKTVVEEEITEVKDDVVVDEVIEEEVKPAPDTVSETVEDIVDKTDEQLSEELEDDKTPVVEDVVKPAEDVVKDPSEEVIDDNTVQEEVVQEDTFNKVDAYDKIMAPFKANGQMVQMDSPEEVIQLMQQGANYTKKMQALQPKLKLLRTLENNNIGDVDKLNFLIDLDKKDPKAIHKLLRDSNIDPMNVDTSVESGYVPSDYSASDAQVNFETTSDDLLLSESGTELMRSVIQEWDSTSQQTVYKDPTILTVLNQQKESGIYETIVNEVNKRRMLGNINPTEPFINSYFNVGQSLQKENRLAPQNTPQVTTPSQETRKVLDTRPATTKAATNNKQAAAVAGNKTPAKNVKQDDEFNPLSMSDEEFMKKYKL